MKLNIEMSLANLIARLARSGVARADAYAISNSHSEQRSRNHETSESRDIGLKSFTQSTVQAEGASNIGSASTSTSGIQKRLDYKVTIEQNHSRGRSADGDNYSSEGDIEDQISLANNPGYPRGSAEGKFASPPRADV